MDSLTCGVWAVHSEISSFEFEMQDSSNLKISACPRFVIWGPCTHFAGGNDPRYAEIETISSSVSFSTGFFIN
jgi:hypothetical protein